VKAYDALTEEAQGRVHAWPQRAQALFKELLEDAVSELQREFIQRSVVAGHTPAEVHAFADELRALSDAQAFDACTLGDRTSGYTVDQLLRAESDPLYAFELRGGRLSPGEEGPWSPIAGEVSGGALTSADIPPEPDFLMKLKAKAERFQADAPKDAPRPKDKRLIGESRVEHTPQPAVKAVAPAALGGGATNRLLEDLLNEATRPLGVTFREHDVDTAAGLTLEKALESAAGPAMRGVPIPVTLGPAPGSHVRFAILLQAQTSAKTRAWQLFDPMTQELVWANEGDLLARAELPLSNKQLRRLTRIALPVGLRASL